MYIFFKPEPQNERHDFVIQYQKLWKTITQFGKPCRCRANAGNYDLSWTIVFGKQKPINLIAQIVAC